MLSDHAGFSEETREHAAWSLDHPHPELHVLAPVDGAGVPDLVGVGHFLPKIGYVLKSSFVRTEVAGTRGRNLTIFSR